MKYYLGIDGGGTKTKFSLCDEAGHILAEYIGPTCHYLQCGLDGITSLFDEGINEVCTKSGISPSDIAFAFAGCAGYGDVEEDCPPIIEAVKASMKDIPFAVGNDCENALAGALAGADGINLIAGTGSMGCGISPAVKESLRCGGWHHAIGSDEGSAYWISWNLLKEFTRQSDGRDEKTALYDKLRQALDIDSDGQLITRVIEEWDMDRTRVASLAPLAAELYDEGDMYAILIIECAAEELADMAIALYRQLEFDGSYTVPVSGTGGVFKMGARITEPLANILEENGMTYQEPLLPPECGSLILALKGGGVEITDEIIDNLR